MTGLLFARVFGGLASEKALIREPLSFLPKGETDDPSKERCSLGSCRDWYLIIIIMITLYGGLATPGEAVAVGSVAAPILREDRIRFSNLPEGHRGGGRF